MNGGGPRTVEEAQKLPEISPMDSVFFGSGGLDGDSICAFVDEDGFTKLVRCIRRTRNGPDEWVKTK